MPSRRRGDEAKTVSCLVVFKLLVRSDGLIDASVSNGSGNPLDEAGCCRCIIC